MDAERLRWLEPNAALEPSAGVEVAGLKDCLQATAQRLAFSPSSWTNDDRITMRAIFDERAANFHTRATPNYFAPLLDALSRGDVDGQGTCLEVGSGVGLQSPILLGHFDEVVSFDLSAEMIARSPRAGAHLLVADASLLPLRDHSITTVVCVNAFLFAEEYLRVLHHRGSIVFVSTRGANTPIYVSPEDLLDALESVGQDRFQARSAYAAEGIWSVIRRR